jgi:hypothetical protein
MSNRKPVVVTVVLTTICGMCIVTANCYCDKLPECNHDLYTYILIREYMNQQMISLIQIAPIAVRSEALPE